MSRGPLRPRGSNVLRLSGAALVLTTLLGCGAKTEPRSHGRKGLETLPECRVEGRRRPCYTICGEGTEQCVDGTWQYCDAQRPVPPKLEAVVRDFRDSHPDFEQRGTPSGLDLGVVQFLLGADDKPVYNTNRSPLTTTGEEEFYDWYHDVPRVNQRIDSVIIELTPSERDPDLFEYKSSNFFPIDGQGFGNEGRFHNFHFTLELSTAFRYVGGETFSFSGDDDLWVFINRRLAIDIGGRHETLSDSVDLDESAAALQLELGGIYPLHLFFAERHTIASNFNIATTIAEFEFCE